MIATNSKGNASLIPAVAYIRCSSDQQTDASIPAQRSSIEKWAKEHGYRIIRWYVDEAESGWKEAREQFQQLITDLGRGDFQAVLCWDQNRFSRFPVLEANHYWYLLDRAGVHLATCGQGRVDWHSIAGWLTASIKQHSDAQHRFQLSADVKRGKRARAERGEWQGKIPFGYVLGDDRKPVTGDPHEVAIVRRICTECISGKSIRHICHALNNDGERSRRGSEWSTTTTRNILTNVVYVGTYSHGDIIIENNHPAIIDRSTFDTVQRKLKERQPKTTPFMGGGGYLFTGLLRCGACGSAMCGRTSHSGNRHYHCMGYTAKGSAFCDRNTVAQVELAEHIIDAIVERFTSPKVVKQLRAELHKQVKATTTKVNVGRTRKRLATVEGKLTKAKRRLVEVDPDMVPVVQEQIRDLDRQRLDLANAVEAARAPQGELTAEADAKVDSAIALFARLRETLQRADSVLLRELLREAIDRVEVWTDKQPHGSLCRFNLRSGVVHLRGANLFHSPRQSV